MKEFTIILIILIIIIGGAIYIQNYLDSSSDELISELEEIKKMLAETEDSKPREDIKQKVNDLYNKWDTVEEGWSIVVLHSELDLIETSLTKMKSGIEEGERSKALEELETSIFLIDHISQKEKLNLKNIF